MSKKHEEEDTKEMTRRADLADHDEKNRRAAGAKDEEFRRIAPDAPLPDHGLPEPDDEPHREQRRIDRIREEQQIEAQAPRNVVEGEPVTEKVFPFSASINEPQTVSLPLPENVEVPVPAISSLNPPSCMIGDPDFQLIVSGENFFADSVIHFAGHDEPTTFDEEAKTLSTGIKPELWAEPVTVQVQIKNGPEISAPVDFEFLPIARSSTRRK